MRAEEWSPPPPCASPSGPRRVETTTTATPGYGTSALPARRFRCINRFPFWTTPCASCPSGSWPTAHNSNRPTVIDGGAVPDERRLPHLTGYPGGSDKVGNWVNGQFQLDAFGESLLLFAAAARHDHVDSDVWRAVEVTAAAIEARWREPDAGIWELDNRRWAHSRLMCVAGLRAISGTAVTHQAARWESLADTIAADVASDCLHPSGRWQRAPDDERVDAALLLSAVRGAVPANDPRSLATLDAVARELGRDGYVYRFRHDQRPLHDAEGAFVLCGFLMALAMHQQGRPAEATYWFERNRAACGPPGLLTEEFDVGQRQLRGNMPQAFVHALLIETSARLSRPCLAP